MKQIKYFLLLIFQLSFIYANAQIVDDSTKQVYGPKTVSYILEDDILNNRQISRNPDTTFNKFHLFDFNLQSHWSNQNLGNFGTATRYIDYQPIYDIGKQMGFSVFDAYSIDTKNLKYYNTKSPYTVLRYLQNSKNVGRIYFTQSQNINPRLNITFQVQRLTSAKQYGFASPVSRTERLIDSWAVNFSSNYISKNKKYQFLSNYNHLFHKQIEQAGMVNLDSTGYFNTRTMETDLSRFSGFLTGASSLEKHNELHVYQQYKLANGFQLFDVLDIQSRKNFFTDKYAKSKIIAQYAKADTTSDIENLKIAKNFIINNVFGVKGFYKGFNYRAYLRTRLFWVNSNYRRNIADSIKTDLISYSAHQYMLLGGWLAYYFPDSVSKLVAETEFSPDFSASRVNANFYYKNIKLDFLFSNTPPTYFQGFNYGNLAFWSQTIASNGLYKNYFYTGNDFKNVTSISIGGSIVLNGKNWSITPKIKNTTITNYIYYDENAQANQKNDVINPLQVGVDANYSHKRWHFYFNGNYYINKPDVLMLPKVQLNTTIAYHFVYAKTLPLVVGTDIYYKSKYFAPAYMPVTQQFYNPSFTDDSYKSWGLPVIDLYLNAKLGRVSLGLKMAAVNVGPIFGTNFFKTATYFPTPYFPALQRSMHFYVNWPLFD